MDKNWTLPPTIPPEIDQELSGFSNPFFRQLLYNRGINADAAAQAFISAQIPHNDDPFQLDSMETAVDRLRSAIRKREDIAVYGDYDVDGVSATALLTLALESLGGRVRGYIPHRFDEGYGLNIDALAWLKNTGASLVVTVDCGIRSLAEAEFARHAGLDLIITDHHSPTSELPDALAVICHKKPGDRYPDKILTGVGLAYKLIEALMLQFELKPLDALEEYLDLVALGTVADIAPLTGENRSLVRKGLIRLRQQGRQGIVSLAGVAGINPAKTSAHNIGFMLAPRLNASGRLESALASLRLLTTKDIHEAGLLAQQLDDLNRERQRITQVISEKADEQARQNDPDGLILIAYDPEFNAGVVGLAAMRLCERYYRPAVIAQVGEEITRGSCRSIPEFDIIAALDQCADLFERHGGHKAAAGFTICNERLPELVERLRAIALQQLGGRELRPCLHADMEMPLSQLRPELLKYMEWLEPTGQDNPRPAFISRGLSVRAAKAVGRDEAHLKLTVSDGRITYDAIAFRQGNMAKDLPTYVDLLYNFEENEYNGRKNLQLNVIDIHAAE